MNMGRTPPFCTRVEELGRLLHDRQVGGEARVEHGVEADLLERRRQPLEHHAHAFALAVTFEQRGRHGRGHLRDHHGVGVGQGRDHVVHLVALHDRPGGAHAGALAAVHALAHVEPDAEAGGHLGLEPPAHEVDGAHALHVVTGRHAAAAEHALVGVAPQRRRADVHRVLLAHADVAVLAHTQIAGERGELAVAAAHAAQAVLRVARDEQFHDRAPRLEHPRRVRVHRHALLSLERAARQETRVALDLHHAEAAGGGGAGRPVQGAQVRDVHAGAPGGLEDGLAPRGLYLGTVDGELHGRSSQATASTACLGQASAQAPQPVQRSTMME